MNYHMIQILPKNENIIKGDNQLNTKLNEFKFKVGDNLKFKYSKLGNYAREG